MLLSIIVFIDGWNEYLSTSNYCEEGFGGQILMLLPEKYVMIIALRKYFDEFEQNIIQLQNFLDRIMISILSAID